MRGACTTRSGSATGRPAERLEHPSNGGGGNGGGWVGYSRATRTCPPTRPPTRPPFLIPHAPLRASCRPLCSPRHHRDRPHGAPAARRGGGGSLPQARPLDAQGHGWFGGRGREEGTAPPAGVASRLEAAGHAALPQKGSGRGGARTGERARGRAGARAHPSVRRRRALAAGRPPAVARGPWTRPCDCGLLRRRGGGAASRPLGLWICG